MGCCRKSSFREKARPHGLIVPRLARPLRLLALAGIWCNGLAAWFYRHQLRPRTMLLVIVVALLCAVVLRECARSLSSSPHKNH